MAEQFKAKCVETGIPQAQIVKGGYVTVPEDAGHKNSDAFEGFAYRKGSWASGGAGARLTMFRPLAKAYRTV